jgi:hypothetical protein
MKVINNVIYAETYCDLSADVKLKPAVWPGP